MRMSIVEVTDRNELLLAELLQVWRASVIATHLFLSGEAIDEIAGYIPDAIQKVQRLIVATGAAGDTVAFMGIEGRKVEMLFVEPAARGRGWGGNLLRYGIANYAVNELCVNEQNPQARGFYEHMGFYAYKRSEVDEQGNPYPILYLRLG